jgi:peptidoglycan/xylan/chitin deacetylase (PgdA/CDA1 family)
MSLSLPTPVEPDVASWTAPLPTMPTSLARARSGALRAIAARTLPRSILFAHGSRRGRGKRVALTFDDGPDAMTPRYLDLLERLGVRATFFLVGDNVAMARELGEEYVRRGHEVGGHGWSHEPFATMDSHRLADELARTHAVLPAVSGPRPMVRPPRGSLSAMVLLRIAAAGYVTVLWSVDSDDCRTRDPRIIRRRLAPHRVAPGDVVLMHEMQPWTVEALPGAVEALRSAGYGFATVGELMGEAHAFF